MGIFRRRVATLCFLDVIGHFGILSVGKVVTSVEYSKNSLCCALNGFVCAALPDKTFTNTVISPKLLTKL